MLRCCHLSIIRIPFRQRNHFDKTHHFEVVAIGFTHKSGLFAIPALLLHQFGGAFQRIDGLDLAAVGGLVVLLDANLKLDGRKKNPQ